MIINHPTLSFEGRYGSEPCQAVQCDFCSNIAPAGNEMHDAVVAAHKMGYITIRGRTAISPRKWSCPQCTARRNASS
jgi:hypothetical protein